MDKYKRLVGSLIVFALVVLAFISLFVGCADKTPKLRVVMGLSEPEWKVMRQEIFPPFEKKHNIKIEEIQMEAGDLPMVLEAQVEADRVEIDLFAQDNMQLSYLVYKGLVEDLSRYEKKLPKTVIPELLAAGRFKNKLYFMPYRPNVQITYYNKDKFKEYGFRPPGTWQELFMIANVFKEKEKVGKIIFKAYGGIPTATQLYEWIVSAGGDPYTINDQGCVLTFEFLQDLWQYCSPDSVRAKFDTTNEYLARDSAYLAQNWPFGISVIIKDYQKDNIGTYHGFAGPKREAHVIGGEVLGIPKGTKNKKLALKLIEYLQSKEVQEKLAAKLGWPSIRTDSYTNVPNWMRPHFNSVIHAFQFGVYRKNVSYWNDYVKFINEAFIEIVTKGAPVKKTLNYYHDQLENSKRRI